MIKQNNEKVKELKKNKVVNENMTKYNKIAQMKIWQNTIKLLKWKYDKIQ